MEFVNLHVHTSKGSMLDGLASAKDLFDKAKEMGHSAMAVTDHGTLAAHYDAFKASQRTGVKLIPGCEAYFVHSYDPDESGRRKKFERRKHLVLLAQNEIGYRNLLKANYESFQNPEMVVGRVFPRLSWDVLERRSEGLICTSACGQGVIADQIMLGDMDGARKYASRLAALFPGRFFLELQPHHLKVERVDQEWVNRGLIGLARELDLPLVVSADTHYLEKGMAYLKDMLGAIRFKRSLEDERKDGGTLDEFYLKDGDEVHAFLEEHYGRNVADEAVGNTVRIAAMCEDASYLKPSGHRLPAFPVQDEPDYEEFLEWRKADKSSAELAEDAAFMRFRCFKGFKEKFSGLPAEDLKKRWGQVRREVEILEKNHFSSYMLVVADYIKWARKNGILAGPGRGSVGGSLVAHLLDIHTVDPFEYGLLFERFQNAEKKDLPDIDTDFASAGLERVKEYVKEKYGRDSCAMVSNLITYSPKTAISDLARSLRITDPDDPSKNYFQIAADIKNAIPDKDVDGKDVTTIEKALEVSAVFREYARKYPDLIKYAKHFVGLEKEFGTHAAGMVVCDSPIHDFAPLRIDKHGAIAVQAEKEECEERGLVKMDFLGLSTLDVLQEAFRNIEVLGKGGPTRLEDIPLDDARTFEMISRGETRCVFQLGKTTMMMSLCKRIKPSSIFDIALVNALGRPSSGPRKLPDGSIYDERSEYIGRRDKRIPVSYIHPSLKCLEETLGLCIMEEQLMGVAGNVAGWDLNKADKLRKFTKLKGKKPELAAQLEKDFIQGVMEAQGVDEEMAKRIWTEVVEAFGGYGFNRSHAVFYSINGYYTAYLKCHHPAAYLAAKLKVETQKNSITSDDEIGFAKQECRRLGIRIIPPDINRSSSGYEVLDEQTIVMGLAAVKGMGEKAVMAIESQQPFASLPDFIHRTESRIVNKGKIEALAKAGCFDSFGLTRKFVHDENKKVRERLRRVMDKLEKDGYDTESALSEFSLNSHNEEWDRKTLLEYESSVLGQCLSGNLNEIYDGFFTGINITNIAQLKGLPDRHHIVVEVLVKSALREFTIKKQGRNQGRKMIKYAVEDINGDATELTVWPDQYATAKRLLKDGTPVRATCQVSDFNGQKTIMLMNFQQVYGASNGSRKQQQQRQ